jgi:hypothetical protein
MKKEFNITEWTLKNRLTEETENSEYSPYMYSEKGFSCKVCKFVAFNKDEDRWTCSNSEFQKYQQDKGIEKSKAHYLLDNDKNPIEDPSKWCSNWFLPNQ